MCGENNFKKILFQKRYKKCVFFLGNNNLINKFIIVQYVFLSYLLMLKHHQLLRKYTYCYYLLSHNKQNFVISKIGTHHAKLTSN